MFAVYKLQWIQQSIEWSRKDLIEHMKTFGQDIVPYRLTEQLKKAQEEIERQEQAKSDNASLSELKVIATIIGSRREDRKDISEAFLSLTRIILLFVVLALISVPFSPTLAAGE